MKKIFTLLFLLAFAAVGYCQTPISCDEGEQDDPNEKAKKEKPERLDDDDDDPNDPRHPRKRRRKKIPIRGPLDPNEIIGVNGWMVISDEGDTVRWVSPLQPMTYTVYYENDPSMAAAAAQVVTIRVPLDSLMDPSTLGVGSFGFGARVFSVEGYPLQYQERLDLREELNLYVDVVAGYDVIRNEAFWILSSIDPETGVAPAEIDRGYLPINDTSTHEGEGFVTFVIKPYEVLCHTGDTIVSQASIIFDGNEPVLTNRWKNTIDAVCPEGSLQMVDETVDSLFFTFGGTDDATGIALHRLYYTADNSAYRLAGTYNAGQSASFAKEENVSYAFFSLAEDNVGNSEPLPEDLTPIPYGTHMIDVAVTVTPEGTATVEGADTYEAGTDVTLTATPATGYRFKRWLLAGVPQGTENILTLTPNESITFVAEMELIPYDLTVTAAEGTTITTQVFTQSRSNATTNPTTIHHFDSIAVSLSSEPCYHDIHFYLGTEEIDHDTVFEVTDAVEITSIAVPTAVGTGVVKDTVCPGLPYSFHGFNLLATATQTSGEFSRTITTDEGCDSTVTLQLQVKATHTIIFISNGGEGSMPAQSVCDQEDAILSTSAFTNEGFFFAGWATTAGGEVQYTDGAVLSVGNDLTLYAVWSSECVDRIVSRIANPCDSLLWRDYMLCASGIYYDTVPGVVPGGCDSIYSLHLTLRHSSVNDFDIVACKPYTWINGETYSEATDKLVVSTNAEGCDSIMQLHLVMAEAPVLVDELDACDSLVWRDGETYYESTDDPSVMLYGTCDSTVLLHLTVNHSSRIVFDTVVCDDYTWPLNGQFYEASNTEDSVILTNAVQCDSVVTLGLTVNYSSRSMFDTVVCDGYTWPLNSQLYEASNTEDSVVLTNVVGCDSVVNLGLTVNYSNRSVFDTVVCDGYTWPLNGQLYEASNNEDSVILTNAVQCDSVITLDLTVNYSSRSVFDTVVCDGYTWPLNGQLYEASNSEDSVILADIANCDSVVTLALTVNYSSVGSEEVESCNRYVWYGREFTESTDTATHRLTNAVSCDSTVTLDLTINICPVTVLSVCDSFLWEVSGETYYESDTYISGFDTLVLTIKHSTFGDAVDVVACDSYDWYEHVGMTASQTVSHLFPNGNAEQCDSTATINLTVNYSTRGVFDTVVCDGYTWPLNGQLYVVSNSEDSVILTNAAQCDSVVTLGLTVNHSSRSVFDTVVCDSYTWPLNDQHYEASNSEDSVVLTNVVGCDSVVTLGLTVNYTTRSVFDTVVCDAYTWPLNGQFYETSNNEDSVILVNAVQCDSVVTLGLTVNVSTAGDTVAVVCDSFDWYGLHLTESGDTAVTLGNAVGCDSTVTLHLTVNHSNSGIDSVVACNRYIWFGTEFVESTDTAVRTLPGANAAGCDSTVTLDLTVIYCSVTTLTACDSYTWEVSGETYYESDIYVSGNDTLVLTINHSSVYDTAITTCDSYDWFEHVGMTTSQTVSHVFPSGNAEQCDSTINLALTILYSSYRDTTVNVCNSYEWHGMSLTESCDTTFTFTDGCEVVDNLHLTVRHSPVGDTSAVACDSYEWHDMMLTESCDTNFIIPNVVTKRISFIFGNDTIYTYYGLDRCDSIVTLHLTLNHSAVADVDTTVCDSYLWQDRNFTESTDTTMLLSTTAGCDSTLNLHLTLNHSTGSDTSAVACESYDWYEHQGVIFTQDLMRLVPGGNQYGCDSTVTLHLTVNNNSVGDTFAMACESYDWYEHEGLDTTQELTRLLPGGNQYGCDSTVTLHLTVNHGSEGDTFAVACDTFDWYEHIDLVDSQELTHLFPGGDQYGCDSTVTLHLTVNYSNSCIDEVSAVDSITWIDGVTYTASTDEPTYTLTNVDGCDSVVTLHLTVTYTVYHMMTVTSADVTMGTVSPAGDTLVADSSLFTVTATALPGRYFVAWTRDGQVVSTSSSYTFEVMEDMELVATFGYEDFILNLSVNNVSQGTTAPEPGVYTFHVGDQVSVTALPNEDYRLAGWTVNGDTVVTDGDTFAISVTPDLAGLSYYLTALFKDNTGIADADGAPVIISVSGNKIMVIGAAGEEVAVYDVVGRRLQHYVQADDPAIFTMDVSGVYFVKIGNAPARRVVLLK